MEFVRLFGAIALAETIQDGFADRLATFLKFVGSPQIFDIENATMAAPLRATQKKMYLSFTGLADAI